MAGCAWYAANALHVRCVQFTAGFTVAAFARHRVNEQNQDHGDSGRYQRPGDPSRLPARSCSYGVSSLNLHSV